MEKFWSRVEYLAQTVKNPNIIINGTKAITATRGRKILKIMWCVICTAMSIA